MFELVGDMVLEYAAAMRYPELRSFKDNLLGSAFQEEFVISNGFILLYSTFFEGSPEGKQSFTCIS